MAVHLSVLQQRHVRAGWSRRAPRVDAQRRGALAIDLAARDAKVIVARYEASEWLSKARHVVARPRRLLVSQRVGANSLAKAVLLSGNHVRTLWRCESKAIFSAGEFGCADAAGYIGCSARAHAFVTNLWPTETLSAPGESFVNRGRACLVKSHIDDDRSQWSR